MKSIFPNKEIQPTDSLLRKALGSTHQQWQAISQFTHQAYPAAKDEWKFAGEKFGWSFRISEKKRVIVYLLPFDQFFQVSMVFGQKATDQVLASDVAESIKTELKNAKLYAEGRGIRIEIKEGCLVKDIQQLITIKLSH